MHSARNNGQGLVSISPRSLTGYWNVVVSAWRCGPSGTYHILNPRLTSPATSPTGPDALALAAHTLPGVSQRTPRAVDVHAALLEALGRLGVGVDWYHRLRLADEAWDMLAAYLVAVGYVRFGGAAPVLAPGTPAGEHSGGVVIINVVPEQWRRPPEEPLDSRLHLDEASASLEVDEDGKATGWVRVSGERLLPEGLTRWEEALVRLPALPDQLTITHQGVQIEIRELQQTHFIRTANTERYCNG